MKLVIEPFNYKHALYCLEQNVDAIIIGHQKFAIRSNYYFNDQELMYLIENKKNTKIFIKANAFIFEQDLNELTTYLKHLSSLKIDGVIFSDFAIAQINEELSLNLKLRYNPETLNTSYYQFDFFKEVNFDCITLSRELSMQEVIEISNHKTKGLQIELQGHGFLFIMHSRWKLISNFEQYYNTKLHHEQLIIREDLRKLSNIVSEDHAGFHMYSGYQLYTFDLLEELKNIDWLRIDTINLNEQYAFYITDIYVKALMLYKQDSNEYKNYIDTIRNQFIEKSFSPVSHGFLGNKKDFLHMEKNDEK